jgi:hypothetical protein
MKTKTLIISILLVLVLVLNTTHAEDYQYQYFNKKKKHTPFSDYIPKSRLHFQTVPHYLEDYYELYGMKQYYNENTLRKNIAKLKTALSCKFRHPSMALVRIETRDEYNKYRNLMFMHINLLIMRSYLKIGARYDKRRIYFFNLDFAKDIRESLQIAEKMYKQAIPYWEKAKKYARTASNFKITTDLSFMETERYSIIHNELDYGKIINKYIKKTNDKKQKLDTAMNEKS